MLFRLVVLAGNILNMSRVTYRSWPSSRSVAVLPMPSKGSKYQPPVVLSVTIKEIVNVSVMIVQMVNDYSYTDYTNILFIVNTYAISFMM